MKDQVIGFGEIMGRLTPDGFLRFAQVIPGRLNFTFGGAEANVCASVAQLGGNAAFVTALPDNPLGDACVAFLRSLRVDPSHCVRDPAGRLGLYFVETGANQRPSQVVYDRSGAAIAQTPASSYAWDAILSDASWLHVSGITPALSAMAADATRIAVQQAAERGLTVSCDINFRKKLWKWEPGTSPRDLAEKTMRDILPHVHVLIANEEDAADVLGIHAGASDVNAGKLDIDRYPDVASQIAAQFEGLTHIAITLRESLSATHNNWGAMLFETATGQAVFAPMRNERYAPYEIHAIVDRVGGGDAFAAGLIVALMDDRLTTLEDAIAFAAASSCLAHSIYGDINYTSRAEVEALMRGSGSGRVQR